MKTYLISILCMLPQAIVKSKIPSSAWNVEYFPRSNWTIIIHHWCFSIFICKVVIRESWQLSGNHMAVVRQSYGSFQTDTWYVVVINIWFVITYAAFETETFSVLLSYFLNWLIYQNLVEVVHKSWKHLHLPPATSIDLVK